MTKQYKTKVYLTKMNECPEGDGHIGMEGVLYQRCKKCGNIFVVKDKEFIRKQGEKAIED